MLNFDMIGRNLEKEMEIIGDGFATGVTGASTLRTKRSACRLILPAMITSEPVITISTAKMSRCFSPPHYEDYHQVTDHADN